MQIGQQYTVRFPKAEVEAISRYAGDTIRVHPGPVDLPPTQRHYPANSMRLYHVSDPVHTAISPDQGGRGDGLFSYKCVMQPRTDCSFDCSFSPVFSMSKDTSMTIGVQVDTHISVSPVFVCDPHFCIQDECIFVRQGFLRALCSRR